MEYWKQELYHHGIKGQQWGQRNGPPYPLKPGAHSQSEKKAGWRKSLKGLNDERKKRSDEFNKRQIKDLYSMTEEEYKNTYLTSQQKDRKRLEKYGSISKWDSLTDKQKKAIVAASLITVGALTVAYAYNKYGNTGLNYIDDVIIKSGTTIQTLSGDPDRIKLGEHFYTAYLNSDKRTYLANFSNLNRNELKLKLLTNVTGDIKVASPQTVQNELETFIRDLAKSDDGYSMLRAYIQNNSLTPWGTDFKEMTPKLADVNIKMMLNDENFGWANFTERYIKNLNYMYEGSEQYNEKSMPFVKEFYARLKDKGYSALKDTYDMGWTKAPTIVFDRTKLGETAVKEITEKELRNVTIKSGLIGLAVPSSVENLINSSSISVSAITGLGVLGTAEYNANRNKEKD